MNKNKNLLYKGILVVIIILIISLIFILFKKDSIPKIELLGNEKETIYVNEIYREPGYRVINEDGSNYDGEVKIDSNLDNKKIGDYEIIYNVFSNGKIITSAKRIVRVLEHPLTNVTLTLNGPEKVYLFKGDNYVEQGAKAYNGNIDISNDIIIEGDVDTNEEGENYIAYKVVIDGLTKTIYREVIIIDIQMMHTINTKNKLIELTVYSKYFDYVILPDNSKIKETKIKYNIQKDGNYKFIAYAEGGLFKEYIVLIDKLDSLKPIGYCQAILDGSSTEFKLVKGSNNIVKYQYNGQDFYTDNYKLNYEVSNPIIRIYSDNGDYTDVECTIKRMFNNNMNDIMLSKTLTPCNYDWTKYNNELSKLMQEAGLKTRRAVAIAADYLARFDYKVAYSWGGKYVSSGINPKWGCEETVTKDVCTKSTGNMKCIYGMDCTGYTAWAYAQAGFTKDILRTSSQSDGMWGNFNASKHKYSFSGNQNLISQIKPGDIVWTKDPSKHVGIVLGTSSDTLKVANMREGIRISYISTKNGRSTNGDRDFTHFVLFDEFFNMYGTNE